jgi:hypothetical protein
VTLLRNSNPIREQSRCFFLHNTPINLQVNVYELGKFVSFFCRKLYLNLPPNDPSLYVMRFAAALKFGDKEHDVSCAGSEFFVKIANYSYST